MTTFTAYFSFQNAETEWLTKYERVGFVYDNIEDAYLYLFANAEDFRVEKKSLGVDSFVKSGGKRVYLNNEQRDRVFARLAKLKVSA
jgi:hypothetical protein